MIDSSIRSANDFPVAHCDRGGCKISVLEPYGIRLLPKWWSESNGEIRCERCVRVWKDDTGTREFGF